MTSSLILKIKKDTGEMSGEEREGEKEGGREEREGEEGEQEGGREGERRIIE